MTGEVKDESRKRWHHRSKSTIGDLTATSPAPMIEPKDVSLEKAPSTKGKPTGKDFGLGWFKSKKTPSKAPAEEEKVSQTVAATTEEGEDESVSKSVQRVVQGLYDENGPSPKILVTTHNAAREAIRDFSKEFLMQLKQHPEGCAAMEAQMRRHFALDADFPQSDLKYLVQAYIAQRFFVDFENATFGISNPRERPWDVQQHMLNCFEQFKKYKTKSQTVSQLLENRINDSFLSRFCFKKYKTLVSLDAGETFLAGDKHPEGTHPDTPFYRSFLGAAVSVWLLQRLAFSFEQKIGTVYPTGGDEFQRRFMEPVVPGIGDTEDENCDVDLEILFTVFPGFRVSESIVQSSVYIVEKPKAEAPPAAAEAPPAAEAPLAAEAPPAAEATPAAEEPETSTVEVEEKPIKQRRKFSKMFSLPTSISGKRSESAAIKHSQKSSSLKSDTSTKEGDQHETRLHKLIGKITGKKKEKTGTDEASTVDAAEAAPALPSLEEVPPVLTPSLEAPPSTDSKQGMNSTVPGEGDSPLEPLNLELVNEPHSAPEIAVDDDQPLYKTRAEKAANLQSPLRSPRLSSVD